MLFYGFSICLSRSYILKGLVVCDLGQRLLRVVSGLFWLYFLFHSLTFFHFCTFLYGIVPNSGGFIQTFALPLLLFVPNIISLIESKFWA